MIGSNQVTIGALDRTLRRRISKKRWYWESNCNSTVGLLAAEVPLTTIRTTLMDHKVYADTGWLVKGILEHLRIFKIESHNFTHSHKHSYRL